MIDRILERLGIDQRELTGATMATEIPLRASLINRLIARKLATAQGKVTAAVVEPHEDGRFTVHIRLRSSLVPPIPLQLEIAGQPDLPSSPVLVLRWSLAGGIGVFARLAASPVLAIFDVLPQGVRVDGDLVGIDIVEVLRDRKADWIVPFLKRIRLTTKTGMLIVNVEMGV